MWGGNLPLLICVKKLWVWCEQCWSTFLLTGDVHLWVQQKSGSVQSLRWWCYSWLWQVLEGRNSQCLTLCNVQLLLKPYGRGIGLDPVAHCCSLRCVLIEGAGFFHIVIEAGLAWAGTQRLCLSLVMIYDFNPIYSHLQECWTGCKSVKDHKILMERLKSIWVNFLLFWGQEDVAFPSSPLAVMGVGLRCSTCLQEKVKGRRFAFWEYTGVSWALAWEAQWW